MVLSGRDTRRAKNWATQAQLKGVGLPTLLHLSFITECEDYALLEKWRIKASVMFLATFLVAVILPSLGCYAAAVVFLQLVIGWTGESYSGITAASEK